MPTWLIVTYGTIIAIGSYWWLRVLIGNKFDHAYRKLDHIMALVGIEQDELDGIAKDVSDAADTLQGILDSDTPTPAADETAIKAALAKLQGVGPKTQSVEPVPGQE